MSSIQPTGKQFIVEFCTNTQTCRQLDASCLGNINRQVENKFYWLDMENPSPDEFSILNHFQVSLPASVDFAAEQLHPTLTELPNCILLTVFPVVEGRYNIEKYEMKKLILLIGERFIISMHSDCIQEIDLVKQTYESNFRLAGKTPGFLLFLILDTMISKYSLLTRKTSAAIENADSRLREGHHEEMNSKLNELRSGLFKFKGVVELTMHVLTQLSSRKRAHISEAFKTHLEELSENLSSVHDLLDSCKDSISSMHDACYTMLSCQMQERSLRIQAAMRMLELIFVPYYTLATWDYVVSAETWNLIPSWFKIPITAGITLCLPIVVHDIVEQKVKGLKFWAAVSGFICSAILAVIFSVAVFRPPSIGF
ncbi:MAG TPA: magnesium transporter CorA family protein [Candidatus Hypogeohydataceae bacterium YC40]